VHVQLLKLDGLLAMADRTKSFLIE
jgi:hypothetical protein